MKKKLSLYFGATIILIIATLALLAPLLGLPNPNEMSLPEQFAAPSAAHVFGLDQNGSSVLAKVIFGARVSLYVALSVVFISVALGVLIGAVSGFFGGWLDQITMRIIDMLYAFPGFLLAIALVAVLGPSIQNVILAMCMTGWTSYARLVRGEVLHLKNRDYVLAAQALGANNLRLILFHILPNLVGVLVVQASFGLAGTIIAESGLSFLGLGAPPTTPTWGSLLSIGRTHLIEAPHISVFPGVAIVLLVLGFNLFGDGLRDLLDPK